MLDFFKKTKKNTKTSTNQYKTEKTKLLSASEIANHFGITAIDMNKIFKQLGLAEKKDRWWIATEAGIKKGAKQFYDQVKKVKYLKWDESIIDDQEVIDAVNAYQKPKFKRTSDQEKIKKGSIFEEYVANIYRGRGYVSIEYGKEKGREDGGIDLIVKKGREIIFIQCKNWNEKGAWKIKDTNIKAFRTDAEDFIEGKDIFKSYKLIYRYTLSGNFLDKSAYMYIKKLDKNVDYEIIKMKKEY